MLFKRKPQCEHKWQVKGWKNINLYGDGWGNMTKLPTSHKTNATLVCSICGDVKLKERRTWLDDPRDDK